MKTRWLLLPLFQVMVGLQNQERPVLGLPGVTVTAGDVGPGAAKFDLLSRRLNVTSAELTRTYEALKEVRLATDSRLGVSTGLGVEKARSALSYLCQVGRAMYDLAGNVYRHRDLFLEPFTVLEAAAAVKPKAAETNPQERAAREIFENDNVRLIEQSIEHSQRANDPFKRPR